MHCSAPVDELVEEVEKRILPWAEARLTSGLRDHGLYNALARILADSNNNPQVFLTDDDVRNFLRRRFSKLTSGGSSCKNHWSSGSTARSAIRRWPILHMQKASVIGAHRDDQQQLDVQAAG